MALVTPCNNIFLVKLPAPPPAPAVYSITVKAGLTAARQYWYIITDKFGKTYAKQLTADVDGSFELSLADFPTGLFNPYAGSFLLQVKETLQDEAGQPLTFCAKSYDTICMEFADFPESMPSPIIDCH
jgi:hypothetical protein